MSATDDANDRMAGFFERGDLSVLRGVGRGFEAQVGENAVVAIDLGSAECFAIDRDDAVALLAGGFGEQLLKPCADIGNAGRGDDGDFVASTFCGGAEDDAEQCAGIFGYGNCCSRRLRPFASVRSRNLVISRPMTAAGTMPKLESAE